MPEQIQSQSEVKKPKSTFRVRDTFYYLNGKGELLIVNPDSIVGYNRWDAIDQIRQINDVDIISVGEFEERYVAVLDQLGKKFIN